MAYDLLSKKTTNQDWSCGKSAAELWDEAESQRLGKPVHQMAPKRKSTSLTPPPPPSPEPSEETPASNTSGTVLLLGGLAAGALFTTLLKK